MGVKQGKGKYIWADKSVYDGQWLNNKCHAMGVYKWSDGR